MNRTRTAILRGAPSGEGPELPAKRPSRRSSDRRRLEELISRREQHSTEGGEERDRKLMESATAAIADDGASSSLPRLTARDMIMRHSPARHAAAELQLAAEMGSLAGEIVPRRQSRITDGRREERLTGVAARASVVFRDKEHQARVLNVSSLGLMIEADFLPKISEPLLVHLDNGTSGIYFVRWIRGGRIGLGRREEDFICPDAQE